LVIDIHSLLMLIYLVLQHWQFFFNPNFWL
jgi:hypothetical protein